MRLKPANDNTGGTPKMSGLSRLESLVNGFKTTQRSTYTHSDGSYGTGTPLPFLRPRPGNDNTGY